MVQIKNKWGKQMFSKQALTRLQTLLLLSIIITVSFGGIWFYLQSAPDSDPAHFSLNIISRPFIPLKTEDQNQIAIPGQKVIFLVDIEETKNGQGYGEVVEISANVSGASISVNNPFIKSGQIAEIVVIPTQSSINQTLIITIKGARTGFIQTKTIDIEVLDRQDSLKQTASEMKDMFIHWLASNYPEYGISENTEWEGTIVDPGILVVMHYLFLSEDWEMYVTWHIMIPPSDWVKIYLRPRFVEIKSTLAFEISSVQGGDVPHSIELPDWL